MTPQEAVAGCCLSGAVLVAIAVLLTTGEAPRESEPAEVPATRDVYAEMRVSAATWTDGQWPLTVDSVVLVCEGSAEDPSLYVRSPDANGLYSCSAAFF